MSAARPLGDLTAHVVAFCRRLRQAGMPVGPREAVDALQALSRVDVGDRRECYLALRTVLATRRDDLAVFDQLFAEFWNPPQPAGGPQPRTPEPLPAAGDGQAPPPALLEWLDEALQAHGD